MTDSKLADAKIVKALEDFINHNGHCVNCPSIMKNVLNLINRKETEIALSQRRIATLEKLAEHRKKAVFERVERNLELRKDLETANAENESLKAEVERLRDHNGFLMSDIEKVKEKLFGLTGNWDGTFGGIDRIVNEIKTEAYKECIEKVMETALVIKENAFQGCYVISKENLNNLLNELGNRTDDSTTDN